MKVVKVEFELLNESLIKLKKSRITNNLTRINKINHLNHHF